ncbi:MAG: formate--tetrahydrofolate ligase, partial [Oscillospiraceae bacterium]|nr:formate--tetrahydrofolate ligase [Oscillospiraceae bacterium]
HGGPFANIAHGCSSVAATKMGLRLADYVVTEAGFGADLGAEKFLGIKCRTSGLAPKAAVLVTTLRALRYNGGAAKGEFGSPCMDALAKGVCNLEKHLENMAMFGVPTCVAINRYGTDSPEELRLVSEACARLGVRAVESEAYARGGAGAEGLAREIVRLCGEGSGGALRFPYAMDDAIAEKIRKVATAVYGADGVELSPAAAKGVKAIEAMGAGGLPVCMAKTQFSFTDDPTVLGRPKGFTIKVRDVRLYAGAGFVTAYAGEVLTMPGLPKVPSAEGMDVYEDGGIVGLS